MRVVDIMDGLFPHAAAGRRVTFSGFGRSRLIQQRVVNGTVAAEVEPSSTRRALRAHCPLLPGVYGMIDAEGELIYVGVSGRLRARLLTYFTSGPPDAKEQRVAAHTHRVIWEVGDHEFTARLRELELIRQWSPRFNSSGRPGRREIGYIYLSRGEAPNYRFGRRLPQDCRSCWGPLPLTRHTRAAVRRLNQLCQLRDCSDRTPMHFIDQRVFLPVSARPGCIRGELGTCLAPCAGQRIREEYSRGVAAARAFLDGVDQSILARCEASMVAAAAARRYEQAATHRDVWQSLTALSRQLELLREARRDHTGIYTLRGCTGKHWWAVMRGGQVLQVMREPSSPRAARHGRAVIDGNFPLTPSSLVEDYDQIRIVVSWFRQHAELKSAAVLSPGQAAAFCDQLLRPPGCSVLSRSRSGTAARSTACQA